MRRLVMLTVFLFPTLVLQAQDATEEAKSNLATPQTGNPLIVPLDRLPVPPIYQVVRFMDLEWATVADEIQLDRGTEIRCEIAPPSDGHCASITYIISDLARVKKGERLLEFDRTRYSEQLRAAQLELAAAEAEQTRLKIGYDSIVREKENSTLLLSRTEAWCRLELGCFNEELPKKQERLREQVEAIRKEVSVLEAAQPHGAKYSELTDARDRLADAEAELSWTTSRAPLQKLRLELAIEKAMRAVLWNSNSHEAKSVESNSRLAAAITIRDLWHAEVARLSGQLEACIITSPQDGLVLHNGLLHIGDEIRAGEHVLSVTAVATNEGAKAEHVLAIPATVVQEDDDGQWCLELTNRGVQLARIVTGRRNRHFVEIRQGLSEGAQVVLDLAAFPFQTTCPRTLSGVSDWESPAAIIRCEVERPDNRVRFITDKTVVKKGDLVAEIESGPLDAAIHLASQQCVKAASEAEIAAVSEKLSRARSSCDIAEAEEQVKLSNAELAQWGKAGDPSDCLQIEYQHNSAHIENRQPEIIRYRSECEAAEEQSAKAETEFNLGIVDESALDAKRQLRAEAELRLAGSTGKLKQLQADRSRCKWSGEMNRAEAKLQAQDATTALYATRKAREDEIAVAVAAKKATEYQEAETHDALDQLKDQKQRCRILAPCDGTVLLRAEVRPGARMFVRQPVATIVPSPLTRVTKAVVIPRSALSQVADGNYCLVRTDRGLERRAIKLGLQNAFECQVIAGLGFGELVVRDPAVFPCPSAAR